MYAETNQRLLKKKKKKKEKNIGSVNAIEEAERMLTGMSADTIDYIIFIWQSHESWQGF